MPLPLPPSVIDRLVFVKYLVRRGSEEYERGHEVAMAVAVLHFHDAMEIFFHCLADVLGFDVRGVTFTGFPTKVKDVAQKPMIRSGIVDKLNNLRVPLKHQALRPGNAALKALSADVEAFFEQNAREFLAVELQDVSLGDLVTNDAVRAQVKDAEKEVEGGHYGDAMRKLGAALDTLARKVEPGRLPRASRHGTKLDRDFVRSEEVPMFADYEERQAMQRMVTKMNERYQKLVAAIEPLQLGLDPTDFAHFRELTHARMPINDTRANAVFCLNFVIDAALRAQEGGAPGLRDAWSRFTVEIEAESVPLRMFSPEGVVEERRVPRGERFEKVQMTIVSPEGKPGPSGPHWMIGSYDKARRWESVRFLPLEGVRIVEEHEPE